MNGIVLVKKEKNITSHDVVNKIRRIFNTKKVGHLGTLDPLAEGVLAVCINDATKLVQFLQDHDKVYVAKVCLGESRDTFDLEGSILESVEISSIDKGKIDIAIESFKGKQVQIPPIYSSIKVNGKKLYEYARNNIEVTIPPREIEIYDIRRISDVEIIDHKAYFELLVHASKGTYIRSICNDLGKKLGIPSLMAGLTRTKSGIFKIEDASTLEEIENGNFRLFNMLESVSNFTIIEDEIVNHFAKNGRVINSTLIRKYVSQLPKQIIIKQEEELKAFYELDEETNFYKAVRVWN